jgi:hypothetical protein
MAAHDLLINTFGKVDLGVVSRLQTGSTPTSLASTIHMMATS